MLLARLLAAGAMLAFVGMAWLYIFPPKAAGPHDHPLGYFAEHPRWQVQIHLLQGTMWLLGAILALAVPIVITPRSRWGNEVGAAGCLLMAHTMWFQAGSLGQLARWYASDQPSLPHRALESIWVYTQLSTWGGPLEFLAEALVGVWVLLSTEALWPIHPLVSGVGGLLALLSLWKVLDWWLQTFWLLDRRPLHSDSVGYLGVALFPVWLMLLAWTV